jgi:modified peptide precursor CbpA
MDDPKARRPAGYVQRGAESDGKGFGKAVACRRSSCTSESKMTKIVPVQSPSPQSAAQTRPALIAIRKTCDAQGTGLSHFVLMDKQVKQ